MKIIFLGGCPPSHLQNKVKEWGSPTDFAGYAFQTALIEGLDKICDDLKVVTYLWIVTYPKSSKCFFAREFFSHKGDKVKEDVFIGFVNLPVIKRLSLVWRTIRELLRLTKDGDDVYLINYGLSSAIQIPVTILRKRFKKTNLVVPDLPEYMSDNKNWIYRIGKKIDRLIICNCIKKFDSFALLSPHMKSRLPIGTKPWIQLEGIYNPKDNIVKPLGLTINKKIVMYSGALGLRYGVGDLVESFVRINDESFELWLCGNGNAVGMINKYAQQDKRIKYFGVLDREDVLVMQKQATVLVNPRHSSEEYTKYSFPSKTMEYLASGTPVIMSHLKSIPPEYDSHIYYFDDESVEGMKNKIEEICNKPIEELEVFGEKASEFIFSQKTSDIQAKRLYDLLAFN